MARVKHQLPTGEEKAVSVRRMFDSVSPKYDMVNRIMTLGLDSRWRRQTAEALAIAKTSLVCDLACGTGDLCREIEEHGHRAIGFDFSWGMLTAAKTSAPLVQADVLRLPLRDGVAGGITCGFALRNVVSLAGLFAECARILEPGGRVAFLETAEPRARVLRFGHSLYFRRVVPLIGGMMSDRDAYSYLPRSTAYLPEPQELMRMLSDAGFTGVRRRLLGLGAAQIVVGTRT